ncbi:hypothetical protein [Carboxylicivirga sp. RSCT41]|uniref:hypothetical protein n=1 Tax=Carboxylicivirga agarovorans TaxID=3417570 RepID=UPI003D344247
MIKTSMTLVGKIFMCLFFIAVGFAGGVIYTKKQTDTEVNSGNKTEIVIEKNKNGNIIIETEQEETGDDTNDTGKKKKKGFLFF